MRVVRSLAGAEQKKAHLRETGLLESELATADWHWQ